MSLLHPILAFCLLGAIAPAQTNTVGVEPNETKETATDAFGLVAGDWISLPCLTSTFNYFRVRTASLPLGVYRHVLRDDLPWGGGRVRIMGSDALIDDVLQGSIAVLATSSDLPSVPVGQVTYVAWYGFGKAEEIYVDLAPSGGCRFGTVAILSTTPVAVRDMGVLPDSSTPSSGWRISARGAVTTVDAEIHVFDAEFNAIPGGWNDDWELNGRSLIGDLKLPSGTYYAAVADKGIASHLPPTADVFEWSVPSAVNDFAGPLIAGSTVVPLDIVVRIEGGGTGQALEATVTKQEPFEAVWVRFTIGATQSTASFCFGDGSSAPCPCANETPIGAAMGCANSTGRGATMLYSYFSSVEPVQFTIEDLPPDAGTVVFVGTNTQAAEPILGGLLCLAPGAVRLPPTFANDDGTAVVRADITPLGGFMIGQTVHAQAAYRDPTAPSGCTVGISSGLSFTLR